MDQSLSSSNVSVSGHPPGSRIPSDGNYARSLVPDQRCLLLRSHWDRYFALESWRPAFGSPVPLPVSNDPGRFPSSVGWQSFQGIEFQLVQSSGPCATYLWHLRNYFRPGDSAHTLYGFDSRRAQPVD